ncbi:MAG: hypothetical protein H0T89_24840 [Deltaproteobacteria bacterium]|nr:hypothetical protein [Deltaproteobacteria bacterium]MDQ3298083.1 hypothetical protein [Myxococcota bacterium]
MALIRCPECSTEVSSSAHKCMKCGRVINKPTRGVFGKLFKWSFIGFNVLMLIWLVSGMSAASKHVETAASDAEKAGATIGTALGAGVIVGIWVAGDIILGMLVLFTRPKTS